MCYFCPYLLNMVSPKVCRFGIWERGSWTNITTETYFKLVFSFSSIQTFTRAEFVQVISFTFSFGLEASCRLELQSLMSISCRVGSHKYLTNQNQNQKNIEEEMIFAKYKYKYKYKYLTHQKQKTMELEDMIFATRRKINRKVIGIWFCLKA